MLELIIGLAGMAVSALLTSSSNKVSRDAMAHTEAILKAAQEASANGTNAYAEVTGILNKINEYIPGFTSYFTNALNQIGLAASYTNGQMRVSASAAQSFAQSINNHITQLTNSISKWENVINTIIDAYKSNSLSAGDARSLYTKAAEFYNAGVKAIQAGVNRYPALSKSAITNSLETIDTSSDKINKIFPELSKNTTKYLEEKVKESDENFNEDNPDYKLAVGADKWDNKHNKNKSTHQDQPSTTNVDNYHKKRREEAIQRAKGSSEYRALEKVEQESNEKSLEESSKINEQIDKNLQSDIKLETNDPNSSWKVYDQQYKNTFATTGPISLNTDIPQLSTNNNNNNNK